MAEVMSFVPGDRFMYINVGGKQVTWTRDELGAWRADDGRPSKVDDRYMREHVINMLEDPFLTWSFLRVVGGNDG